jgi:hypothetical protein
LIKSYASKRLDIPSAHAWSAQAAGLMGAQQIGLERGAHE